MRRLALLLLLNPAAAAAQQSIPVQYDPAVIETCLAARSGSARSECIGTGADHCMTIDSAGSTNVGMGFCYGAERDDWDARLNASYTQLMAIEKAIDAELEQLGSAAPKTAPVLRDMQRAWIAFRDASCNYEGSQWGGGSGTGPAMSLCAMRMTAEQALTLMARLEEKKAR